MTRMAPGFPVLAALTSAAYAAPDLRFRPPDGVRPSSVWHDVHAGVRICAWICVEKLGPADGVGAGAAGLLEPLLHAAATMPAEATNTPAATLTVRLLTRVPFPRQVKVV